MSRSLWIRAAVCVASVASLADCLSAESASCPSGTNCPAGSAGSSTSSGGPSGAGQSASAAGSGSGNPTPTGGAASQAGAPSGNAGTMQNGTGGAGTTGGASAGGAPVAGTSAQGGSNPSGGTNTQAGAGTQGGSAQGGAAAGAAGAGMAGGGPITDKNGKALAKPGDSTTQSRDYLNLGDFRVLNNKWGSDELSCPTMMKVFVNNDKSFGWSFDRATCGGDKQKPDYPEIEFGIHPFGMGSSLATSPSFPSTSVLPKQIKDITSASVVLDSLNASIQKSTTWNVDFELWLSQQNPVTSADPGVYAEVIAFWGWQDSWACDKSGSVTAGDKTYSLCHQDDAWAGGKWRYFQFRVNGGPIQTFSGKVDVKAFLDWLVSTRSYSKDLWVTRLEVGSELDDNTSGSVTFKNVTFEVNGTSKTAQFGQ